MQLLELPYKWLPGKDDVYLMASAGALLLLIDDINYAVIHRTTEDFNSVEQLKLITKSPLRGKKESLYFTDSLTF